MRLLAAIRVASSSPFTALVLAIAALADVVSFEAIRAFAIETAAFPPSWPGRRRCWSTPSPPPPAWSSSGATCAETPGVTPGMPGPLAAAATAVSIALNVAHAPDRLAAQLFAALPPVALLERWSC
ncbi:MAG TPA: hypothetical protein VFQ49_08955 [Actinomycetes bacterium]|nr:hypothetical protein [Actinomycetes bacterium]